MLSVQQQPLLIEHIEEHSVTSPVEFRPLQPSDYLAVKEAHALLFPIDYDDNFFYKATKGIDRIWSCAAFSTSPCGTQQLVGFITAKTVFLHECSTTDRQHLGLLSAVVDHDRVLYILTLGVMEGYRHQGIASTLIQMVCQHGYDTRCRAVFLHVITYNTAAQALYTRQGFTCVARLSNFYYIATGRQPDPATVVYDAYLYVQFIGPGGGLVTPWDMITLAWTPVRSALGRIHSCMPGFCRHQAHQYPNGVSADDFTDPEAAATAATTAGDPSYSSTCSNLVPINGSYHPPTIQMQVQQQQQPQQQQQRLAFLWSRQRHRGSSYGSFAASGSMQHNSSEVLVQQQEQPHQRQQQQHRSQQLKQQQPPPQRMLRWLFNGQSRAVHASTGSSSSQQQQQLFGGVDDEQSTHIA